MKKYVDMFVIMLLLAAMCLSGASCTADADGEQTSVQESGTAEKDIMIDNNSDYELQYVGDKSYIVFDDISKYSPAALDDSCEVEPGLTFSSIKEFKDTVVGGKLTDEQKLTVSKFRKDETGKIETVDFNNLYTPVLPSGCTVSGVSWCNNDYEIDLKDNLGRVKFNGMDIQTQEEYNAEYEEKCKLISSENKLITITKTEELDGGKTATYYTTDVGEFMRLSYTLTSGNKTCTVMKKYCLKLYNDRLEDLISVSSTVPEYFYLFYTDNGKYYYLSCVEPIGEDIDDSFIMSIGATRYVDQPNTEVK